MHGVLLYALRLWVALVVHHDAVTMDAIPTIQRRRGDAIAGYKQSIANVVSAITSSGQTLLRGLYDADVKTASVSPSTCFHTWRLTRSRSTSLEL
jgi:hypothetical protein